MLDRTATYMPTMPATPEHRAPNMNDRVVREREGRGCRLVRVRLAEERVQHVDHDPSAMLSVPMGDTGAAGRPPRLPESRRRSSACRECRCLAEHVAPQAQATARARTESPRTRTISIVGCGSLEPTRARASYRFEGGPLRHRSRSARPECEPGRTGTPSCAAGTPGRTPHRRSAAPRPPA